MNLSRQRQGLVGEGKGKGEGKGIEKGIEKGERRKEKKDWIGGLVRWGEKDI